MQPFALHQKIMNPAGLSGAATGIISSRTIVNRPLQRSKRRASPAYDTFRIIQNCALSFRLKMLPTLTLTEEGLTRMRRIGMVRFKAEGREQVLTLFSFLGYGGGLFLPFRDRTNRGGLATGGTDAQASANESDRIVVRDANDFEDPKAPEHRTGSDSEMRTYGGGRYLIDTVKHADLGGDKDEIIIDFNYAYNPSCAYNPRWNCPLAPPENRLDVPIEAGELEFHG